MAESRFPSAGVANPGAATDARRDPLAGLQGRLPRPAVPFAYLLGLLVVTAAMLVLPALYLSIILAAGWSVVWWTVYGFGLLLHGSMGSIKIRLFLYLAPLVAGGSLPLFLLKPVFSRATAPPNDLELDPRRERRLFEFVRRLAAVVGAPAPDRVIVDCEVNAGAGLELGLLRRRGSALVLVIGLPLVAGLTLPQFASVLAHEFGHFGQGIGMRLGRLIRGVNAWFQRVVYERDSWDEALERGTQEGGWAGLAYLGARLMVALGRGVLYLLMVAGHAVSCFLSRQMEFDADQYGARVAGSSTFADASLRVRVLSAAAGFVMTSALKEDRLVDDLPALVSRVADQAPPRLVADIRTRERLSGTGLFDTHPSDLERLRRVRAARFTGLLSGDTAASELFRDFPALCRDATYAFYERALGRDAPPAEALLPVEAFVAAARPAERQRSAPELVFPTERPPRISAHVAERPGDAAACAEFRAGWSALAPAAVASLEQYRRAHGQWLDAAQADALLAAGLTLQAREFSLPAATAEGVRRTRDRASAMLAQANAGLEPAERALGERIGRAVGILTAGLVEISDAAALQREASRLLAAVAAFEAAQAEIEVMRTRTIVLECLLGNQKSQMGHVGLEQQIQSLLPDTRRAIEMVRSCLEKAALPGLDWEINPPWRDDSGSHARSSRRALDEIEAQHARAVARLLEIAGLAESALPRSHRPA